MRLYTINAGHFKLDGGAMFGVVPKSMWNKLNPADDNNMCSWAMRCLLIEEGDKRILIDTGMGDKQDQKFFDRYYLHGDDTLEKSLAAHGFKKDDITDVILTHLHFDHCGGAIIREGDKLLPAFKNATYWSNEQHWKWATEPNEREKASFLKENILPIQQSGKLKMVNDKWLTVNGMRTAESLIIPSLSYKIVDGHTDAMMLPVIQYKDKTIVFVADLLPSPAHIPMPYIMAYDMFPMKTLNEKKLFLNEAEQNNYILFFEHDPEIECCTVKQTDKGIRMDRVFKLEDI
jgi:glyoxylase-like metal-dependent hydrolase (beta-lactamase superfamily II)